MRELLHSPLIRFVWWGGLAHLLFRYASGMPEDASTNLAVLVGTLGALQKITAELDGLRVQIRKIAEGMSHRVAERWPQ
jgi:hypothetical protein